MSRKLLAVMITLLLMLSLFPASSLAAGSVAPAKPVQSTAGSIPTPDFSKTPDKKALDKIKADMLTLVKDKPTGGKTISLSALEKTLAPYRAKYKVGSGNSSYMEMFTGDYTKLSKQWALGETADVMASWLQDKTQSMRMEKMIVKSSEEDLKEGMINCTLMTSDKAFSYVYEWVKFQKTGKMLKMPKMPPSKEQNDDKTPVVNDETGKLYPDQTVNGQLCKVYSFGTGVNETLYWLSTTKGFDIKTADFSSAIGQTITYTYEMKKVSKDAGFYNPPSDVKFSTDDFDATELDQYDDTSVTWGDSE